MCSAMGPPLRHSALSDNYWLQYWLSQRESRAIAKMTARCALYKYWSWALAEIGHLNYPRWRRQRQRACLHSFIVTSKSAISREILRKFEFIAVEGHPIGHQSWCQSKAHYATFYLSLTATLAVSPTVFEKLTFKTRKWLVFPHSLVRRSRSGRTH